MKIRNILIAALSLLAMTACSSKKEGQAEEQAPKYLVLCYSQTGTTQKVAEELQKRLGADLEMISLGDAYPDSYDGTIAQCKQEIQEGKVPQIDPIKANIAEYDVVFLGYPIWFGTYARPILGLLETQDFAGKTVVPFATFGSGGLEASIADLKAKLPQAEIAEGYGVRTARIDAMPAELNRFLIEGGYVEGEIEPLPAYGETAPVTEEQAAVFAAAVDGYPFPLGTPVAVASRQTPDGVDYKYQVKSTDMQGNEVDGIVYVLQADGTAPVFTRVVR